MIRTPPTSEPVAVEFRPSVDSLIYISTVLGKRVEHPKIYVMAYQAFFLLNAIFVPAFLFLYANAAVAVSVFAVDIVLLIYLLPRLTRSHHLSYYKQLFGHLENQTLRVELLNDGIRSDCNGNAAFVAWQNIVSIDETDNAIFFMFGHNGVAVQKNGFSSKELEKAFLSYAHSCRDKAEAGE